MAQEFQKYYKMFMKEAYSTDSFMSLLSIKNNSTQFIGIARPITNGVEYKLHVAKRNKPKTVTLGTTTAKALGVMDNFPDFSPDTQTVTSTTPHTIGVKYFYNDALFFGEKKDLHLNWLQKSINAISALRMEEIIAAMVAGKSASQASTSDVWLNIAKDIEKVAGAADDYVYNIDRARVFVWINPNYALSLAKEKGAIFRNEVPVFKTGLSVKESINGAPLFRNQYLTSTTVGNKNIAYIVFALDAILFDYMNPAYIDQTLGLNRYIGYVFFDLIHRVYANRIIVRTFSDSTRPKIKA